MTLRLGFGENADTDNLFCEFSERDDHFVVRIPLSFLDLNSTFMKYK